MQTAAAPVKGAGLILLACGLLSLNDAAMKLVVADTPIYQAIFIRGVIALVPILFLARRQGGIQTLRWRNLRGQMVAAFLWAGSVFLFTACLQFLPLAIATVMIYTSPLFVAVLAPRFLGERVGWRHICAVIIGFLGVIFVVQPGGEQISWAVLMPFAAAFILAIRDIGLRQLVVSDNSLSIHVFSNIVVSVCALSFAVFNWAPIDYVDFWLLVGAGLASGFALFCMIEAFRFVEASSASAFKISGVVWAGLLGFLIWGDVPSGGQWVGFLLIVGSGVYVLQSRIVPNDS